MKTLKIILVLVVLGVILYLAYTKLIKKENKSGLNASDECKAMKDVYGIIPGQTFGTATDEIKAKWVAQRCFM